MTTPFEILSERANPRRRILLVDDDAHLLEVIAVALIQSGYDVDSAADGAAAWDALHAVFVIYHLLITDNQMPKVTGLELIRKMRAEEITLPVILVSSEIPTKELARQPGLQLDATLEKPFTIEELLDAVKYVIQTADSPAGSPPLELEHYTLTNHPTPQVEKPVNVPIRHQRALSRRILVVDDEDDTRQLSVDVLTGSGYDVEGVKDGAAGWQAFLAGNHYDLVVTDNHMPNMTGVELVEKLRAARNPVPVIMATTYVPTHEFARKPWLKVSATLQRPFSVNDLLETVKKVLPPEEGNPAHGKMIL